MPQEPLYTVGVIVNTHGLRGEVRVVSRTDFPEKRFAAGSVLQLVRPDAEAPERSVRVAASRRHKQLYIVLFEGFASIDQAQKIKGCTLKVYESELERLPEGTYYIHQLIGCEVTDEQGQRLGTLTEVLQPGANDVYVVRNRDTGKYWLLPAIPEVILDVRPHEKRMMVRPMEEWNDGSD